MKCFECNVPMTQNPCNPDREIQTCLIHTCPKCGKSIHSKRGTKQQ